MLIGKHFPKYISSQNVNQKWNELKNQSTIMYLRYTNVDLKISLYVCVHIKMIP